jgi:fucose 4-O-acetylase-like acetyltransferase
MSVVKALGIIFIVAGHAAINTAFCRFLYLFHVTIFFFVAGYFFNDNYINSPIKFISSKIKRLYIPWLIYGIVFVLLHNFFLKHNFILYNFNSRKYFEPYSLEIIGNKILNVLTFFRWKEPLLAPMWFLFGLFSGLMVFYVVTFAIKKFKLKKPEFFRSISIIVISAVGFLGAAFHPRFGIFYKAFVISGIIYLGKLYSLNESGIKVHPAGGLLSLIILIVATVLKYDVNVGGMKFGNPLFFMIVSCAGFYFTLSIADLIARKPNLFSRALNIIGENTLTIMALHYLAFKFVNLLQIAIYNYPVKYLAYYPVIPFKTAYWWVAYTIVGIIVPLLLAIIYDKTKYFLVSNSKNFFRTSKEMEIH